LKAAVRSELDILVKTIAAAAPVAQIYLFGSYAYGTPHKDSDLDIYVVLKDESPVRDIDAIHLIRAAIAPAQSMPVDLLALKASRFRDRQDGVATIERVIAEKGVKLYG
jgi:predicted nucleotidyltransferase